MTMRSALLAAAGVLGLAGGAWAAASPGRPEVFGPGVISGALSVDAATFSPDGRTVYFGQHDGPKSTIMVSHLVKGRWSRPQVAPFSGVWGDKDAAMAPDGSFIIFGSNRPAAPGGKPVDMVFADGTVKAGQGNHLWRVDRAGTGWAAPVRLPDSINDGGRIFSASVVADGSVYFQRPDPASKTVHLYRSAWRNGAYQPPTPVTIGPPAADERDPAVAADESYMVLNAAYGPKGSDHRLYIVFREAGRWGTPIDLGPAVNHDGAEGPHLGPGGREVYYDSGEGGGESHIWRLSLTSWLAAHRTAGACGAARRLTVGPRSLFAPEAVWPAGTDASPAFTPDGKTVFYTHAAGAQRTVMVSHLMNGAWSAPQVAPFSGTWRDIEPAMAPDGSYLVFISNRPATAGGEALTGFFGGQSRPGAGGNIWRVDHAGADWGDGWGEPVRLPDVVNRSPATYSPAVTADGSLYFNQPDPVTHRSVVYRSQALAGGGFGPPEAMAWSQGPGSGYDVAVAPDDRALVYSSGRPPAAEGQSLVFVAVRQGSGWSAPVALDPHVEGIEARFSPDLKTLYVSTEVPAAPGEIAHSRIFSLPVTWAKGCGGPPAKARRRA